MEESFLPIQSLDIEAEKTITFDLFINLPLNNKYILYRRAGGTLEAGKLEELSQKNFTNFFISKKDYAEFVKYVAHRMKALVSNMPSEENKKLMVSAAKSILSSTFASNDPATTHALMGSLNDICGIVIESVFEVSSKNKKLYRNLLELASRGTDYQKHPINVASIAVMITCGIGYTSDKILSDLSMAALLHDIGLSRLPPKLITMAHHVQELSMQDKRLVYSHPRLALEILHDKGINLSFMAKTIILQHHEEYNGGGYPNNVRGYNLNELAQVVRVADEIDKMFAQLNQTDKNLKVRLEEYFTDARLMKSIEPSLLERIRQVVL